DPLFDSSVPTIVFNNVGRTATLVVLGYGSLSQQCLDGGRLLSSEWRPAGAERRRRVDSHLAMPGPRPKPKPEKWRFFPYPRRAAPSTVSFSKHPPGMPLVRGSHRRRHDAAATHPEQLQG